MDETLREKAPSRATLTRGRYLAAVDAFMIEINVAEGSHENVGTKSQ